MQTRNKKFVQVVLLLLKCMKFSFSPMGNAFLKSETYSVFISCVSSYTKHRIQLVSGYDQRVGE